MTYIALLRGINVGGNNIIKMVDLKACFEEMGFEGVSTYIQSGNVIFSSDEHDQVALTEKIEKMLSKKFDYKSSVVTISDKQLKEAVDGAPRGFGSEPGEYRYDVIFLKKPLQAKEAIKSVSVKDGVDAAWVGKEVLYFSRLIEMASQSYLTRIVSLPIYQKMTIRNWNTTTKLKALVEDNA